MTTISRLLSIGAVFLIASCSHFKGQETREPASGGEAITVDVGVTVTGDRESGYKFAYEGEYFDSDGNYDLSVGKAQYSRVILNFSIGEGSIPGIRFREDGRDVMWIIEKERIGEGESPKGPYQGEQFRDFRTSGDGSSFSVFNQNDDSVLYRYALRFDLNGEIVQHDPDGQNGPHD